MPGIHPEIAKIVDRALAFDPAERWQTVAEMGEAIRKLYTSLFGSLPTLIRRPPSVGVILSSGQELLLRAGSTTTASPVSFARAPTESSAMLPSAEIDSHARIQRQTVSRRRQVQAAAFAALSAADRRRAGAGMAGKGGDDRVQRAGSESAGSCGAAGDGGAPRIGRRRSRGRRGRDADAVGRSRRSRRGHRHRPHGDDDADQECAGARRDTPWSRLHRPLHDRLPRSPPLEAELPLNRIVACLAAVAMLATASSARATPPSKQACAEANEDSQELRNGGHLRDARERLVFCAAQACPRLVRNDCAERLAEVERQLPTLALHVEDGHGHDLAGVKVTDNGDEVPDATKGKPLTLDPGEHRFTFDAPGFVHTEQRFVLIQGIQGGSST